MLIQEQKESVRHRFLQFENADVTKLFGFPPGKPDFRLVLHKTHKDLIKKNSLNQIFQCFELITQFPTHPGFKFVSWQMFLNN